MSEDRLLSVLRYNGYQPYLTLLSNLDVEYMKENPIRIDEIDGDALYLRRRSFTDNQIISYCDVVDEESTLLFVRDDSVFFALIEKLRWAFTRIDWAKEAVHRLKSIGYRKERFGLYVREAYEKRFCFEFRSGHYSMYIVYPAKETSDGRVIPPTLYGRRNFFRSEGDLLHNVMSYEKEHLVIEDYSLMSKRLREMLVKE